MSQRLVIKFIYDKELIATIYYRWSGFTLSSLEETKSLLDNIYFSPSFYNIPPYYNLKNYKKAVIFQIISYLEANGGGLDPDDREFAEKYFLNRNFSTSVNSIYGVLALSPDSMRYMLHTADAVVEINFDTGRIYNDTLTICNMDQYIDRYCNGNDENLYIPLLNFELIDIDFNNLDNTIKILKSSSSSSYIEPNSSLIYVLY